MKTRARSASSRALDRHRNSVFSIIRPLYREPITLARGSGCWVHDVEGKRYLDAFAGILTTSLGHCHPEIVDAISRQAAALGHVSTLYLNEPQLDAAEHLGEISPGGLDRCFFLNSGTEAIETAIATARQYTGRTDIVALRHAYHGRSALAASVTAQAPWRPAPNTTTGVAHALAPYPYRSPFGRIGDEELTRKHAEDLVEVIETTTNGRPAAFIAETILGVGGFVVPPKGYFARMAEIVRSYGGLFISDEVQTGFGRTGGRWFGIEHWDVTPDILVAAKGMSAGFPVGAVVTTREISEGWTGKSLSTFGGNPIAMAATLAAIKVMRREDARRRAEERGAQLRQGLEALALEYRWIGEARGMGLMQGIELVEDPETKEPSPRLGQALLEAAKEEGLLVGLSGLYGQVVRIGPSLLVSQEEMDTLLGRLGRAAAKVEAAQSSTAT